MSLTSDWNTLTFSLAAKCLLSKIQKKCWLAAFMLIHWTWKCLSWSWLSVALALTEDTNIMFSECPHSPSGSGYLRLTEESDGSSTDKTFAAADNCLEHFINMSRPSPPDNNIRLTTCQVINLRSTGLSWNWDKYFKCQIKSLDLSSNICLLSQCSKHFTFKEMLLGFHSTSVDFIIVIDITISWRVPATLEILKVRQEFLWLFIFFSRFVLFWCVLESNCTFQSFH